MIYHIRPDKNPIPEHAYLYHIKHNNLLWIVNYYLRINILPKVQIESLSSTGESIIMCNSNDELMKVPLSSIIYANSEVDPSKLQISVISNEYSIYVQGEGNNRNQKLDKDQGNTLENYGIVLNKTVLGGPVIKIVVFDEYGYQVADSTGNPIILTIYYKNKDGDSIQVDLNQSSSNVYEGDAFEIWAKCEVAGEIKYFKYDNGTWGDGQTAMPSKNDNISFIILENIPLGTDTDKPIQVTIALAESQELKKKLNGTTLLNGSKLNFINNKHFENQEKITGNNFTLTIKATVGEIEESISLQVNTTINQRYKLVFDLPYDKYETLYVPHGEADDETVSKYFVLYDIKNSKVIELDSNSMGITVSEGKGFVNVTTPQFDSNGFVNDGFGTWEGTYKYTVNGANIEGSLIFNYQLTQKYFGVDTSQANIVGSYGVVVPGSATNSAIEINVWGNGIKLVDYYGNKTSIIDETADEFVDNTSLNPGAGETVVVNVYGDSSTKENTLIGTIKVTRAKYYDVNVTEGATIKENNGILPFKDGWGDVIKAVVSGETSEEAISGGLSGFFSYNIIDSAAKVVYDESQGTYVINTNNAGSFTLEISYMNIFLGNVYFGKIGDNWVVSKLNFQPITVTNPTSETLAGKNNTTWGAEDHVAYMVETGSLTFENGYSGCATIDIPATFNDKPVVAIGNNAFKKLTNLTTLILTNATNLKMIGNSAFEGCTSLTSIIIPAGVTSIGNSAFTGCSGLETIQVEEKNTVYHSVNNCLIETATKQLILGCKSSLIPADGTVTSIGESAFSGCSRLTSITIPEGVASIGGNAFKDCSGLTSLTLPSSLIKIGNSAFEGCTGITGSLTIPDSVTTIGSSAFRNCTGFTGSLTIGSKVQTIGDYAFMSCNGFTGSLTIGNSVTSIGNYAFHGCSGFTGSLTIGSSVQTIGDSAFDGCSGLYTVTIDSENISSLSSSDSNLLSYAEFVYVKTELSVGAYITGSFTKQATSDKSGYNMYYKTSLLGLVFQPITIDQPTSITISGGNNTTEGAADHVAYMIGTGSSTYGNGYNGTGSEISIPATFKGKPVVAIGNNAFRSLRDLTTLTLTNATNLKLIGNYAFSYCSGFTGSLTIPNSATSIGEYAFSYCIGFTGSLTIPNSVETIGDYAFRNCSGFTGSLTIGSSVQTIGHYAFYDCSGFTGSLTIPNSVKTIGDYAFYGCSGFTGNLTIPNSVTSIGSSAFGYCSGFTGSLTIGSSVKTIGNSSFANNLFNSIQIYSIDICEMDNAPGNIYDNAEYLFVSDTIDTGSVGEAITDNYNYKGTFGSLHYYTRKEITP